MGDDEHADEGVRASRERDVGGIPVADGQAVEQNVVIQPPTAERGEPLHLLTAGVRAPIAGIGKARHLTQRKCALTIAGEQAEDAAISEELRTQQKCLGKGVLNRLVRCENVRQRGEVCQYLGAGLGLPWLR